MNEHDAAHAEHQASGSSNQNSPFPGARDDVTGTDNVNLGKEKAPKTKGKKKTSTKKASATKPGAKSNTELTQPQSIDDAIASGMKPKDLDDLVKAWGKYNQQEAARQAKATTEAMASSVQARRRQIADELLKLADGYGISMSEARNIFEEARAAEKGGKLK